MIDRDVYLLFFSGFGFGIFATLAFQGLLM